MTKSQITQIQAMGSALQKYQNGDSLTDAELRDALAFTELLCEIAYAHPDCRVFRLYNNTASALRDFARTRGIG